MLADVAEMGLIHGEINGANAGRRSNGEVALLDFVVDHGGARAFYAGYTDAGGQIDHDRLFDAALLHALRYMWFGDVHRRWEQILHAVKHRTY
jgi:hypothetical protein